MAHIVLAQEALAALIPQQDSTVRPDDQPAARLTNDTRSYRALTQKLGGALFEIRSERQPAPD
jgi:hypothetical protein